VRFLLICWSRSLVSNYKFETKNDARVKCDFEVLIGFPSFENLGVGVESEYDIRKIFGTDWSRSRIEVRVRNKRFHPSLVHDRDEHGSDPDWALVTDRIGSGL